MYKAWCPDRSRARTRPAAVLALLLSATLLAAQPRVIGPSERVADGVRLYRLDDPALLSPPGPVSVQALRLDPRLVRLETAVAEKAMPARETVASIATRRGAVAAVNGGFFSLESGKPSALFKTGGILVGRTRRPRGAVAITERRGVGGLLFDRVTTDKTAGAPRYHTRLGSSPTDWAAARHAVSGAGLLMLDGRDVTDWTDERITAGFDTTRHPRTLIGVDADAAIWLVTVDGRQPALSLGMTFAELQALSRRLGLRSALNLDGGGSTTMVVRGTVVNHPSDATGPRQVGDALVVLPRKP